jgi:hypothetical protein
VIVPVSELGGPDSLDGFALTHRVLTGNLRLLAGMVRANHPWRLTTRLSRAMIGALGVATFTIVTADVWRIASGLAALATVGGAFGGALESDTAVREATYAYRHHQS